MAGEGATMRIVNRMLDPLRRKIRLLASRAVVVLVNDALKMQSLQVNVLAGEIKSEVERFQNFGFTSVPLAGAEGVYVSIGSNRDHGVIVALDDRSLRPKGLLPGESQQYDKTGSKVHLKADGSIEVFASAGGGKVTLSAAGVATIDATTKIEFGPGATESLVKGDAFKLLFNTHIHTVAAFGPTTVPTILMDVVPFTHTSAKVKTK